MTQATHHEHCLEDLELQKKRSEAAKAHWEERIAFAKMVKVWGKAAAIWLSLIAAVFLFATQGPGSLPFKL